jgi:hypothetical protein
MIFCLIARAQGRTSEYDIRDIGAIWCGRWQVTHLSKMSGATSRLNVGTDVASGWAASLEALVAATTKPTPASTKSLDFMRSPSS